MTPREIAEDVYDCWQAGAAIAHLHMRDDEGNGSMDTAKFRETVEILRGEHPDCDIVLNMTTSGALIKDEDLRKAHLRSWRPRWAPLTAAAELAALCGVPELPSVFGESGQGYAGVGHQAGDRGV